MGYDPGISLQSNPRALRRYCEQMGLVVSQIDGSYPLMGPDGSAFGVQYVQQSIRFAAELGCPMVDTVDGAFEIEGLSKEEVFRITCDNYRQCLPWAEDYGVIINVEPHGPYTTDGEFMERLFTHFESEYLRMNFDTGNTFISGLDPLEYLQAVPQVPLARAHQGRQRRPGGGRAGRGDGHRLQRGAHRRRRQRRATSKTASRYLQQTRLGRRGLDRVLRLRREHPQERRVPARRAGVVSLSTRRPAKKIFFSKFRRADPAPLAGAAQQRWSARLFHGCHASSNVVRMLRIDLLKATDVPLTTARGNDRRPILAEAFLATGRIDVP